jgi:iron complex outermembrane recepter protein
MILSILSVRPIVSPGNTGRASEGAKTTGRIHCTLHAALAVALDGQSGRTIRFMPSKRTRTAACFAALAAAAAGMPALAQQKSAENAVTSADDAFGNSVGLESTGIYSENNVRGFSPLDAGNARIDGIYFDPVSLITLRMRASQAMRVGYAALDYPFPAPTGIADNQLRTAGNDFGVGVEAHLQQYGSYVGILDTRIPLIADHLGLVAGLSHGNAKYIDGASENNYSFAVKPVIRLAGIEFSPFYSANYVRDTKARPVVLSTGAFVPELPEPKRYYGSPWTDASRDNVNYGATLKAAITDRLSLRAGLFRSSQLRRNNVTELFAGSSRHSIIADPEHDNHSWSGEMQLAWRAQSGSWRHRFIAGFRGRDRQTQSGGSDFESCGTPLLGQSDPEPRCLSRPDFQFTAPNLGKVRQTAVLAGYLGELPGVGKINLGLQRAEFRARFRGPAQTSEIRASHWLYNASAGIELAPEVMVFGGTQRGLEDSGTAPETAANRNEQLPAALSTQYEAGAHWNFGKGHLVVSAFRISKPYFTFDATNRYTRLGTVRHSGVEVSLSGNFHGDRLSVLVGALAMKPEVTGTARDQGLVGSKPVGARPIQLRLDANYNTGLWGGFTPTLSVAYFNTAAASSRLNPELGGKQLMLGPRSSVDIGARQPIRIGSHPGSLRFRVDNLLDTAAWYVLASNTFSPADRRRFSLSLVLDL